MATTNTNDEKKSNVINIGSSDERERAVTIRIKEASGKSFVEGVNKALAQAAKDFGAKTFKATIVGYGE